MKYETPKNSAQLGVEINELNLSETFSSEEIKKSDKCGLIMV